MAVRQGKRSGRSEGFQTAKKVKGKKAKHNPLHGHSLGRKSPARVKMPDTAVGHPDSRLPAMDIPPAEAEHVGRLPLGPDELAELRALLLERRKAAVRLAERVADAEAEIEADRRVNPDLSDRGTDRAMMLLLLREEARELAEIDEIEAALKRIKGRSYGICETCGERIPYRRLIALPEARRCIRCEQERLRAPIKH